MPDNNPPLHVNSDYLLKHDYTVGDRYNKVKNTKEALENPPDDGDDITFSDQYRHVYAYDPKTEDYVYEGQMDKDWVLYDPDGYDNYGYDKDGYDEEGNYGGKTYFDFSDGKYHTYDPPGAPESEYGPKVKHGPASSPSSNQGPSNPPPASDHRPNNPPPASDHRPNNPPPASDQGPSNPPPASDPPPTDQVPMATEAPPPTAT